MSNSAQVKIYKKTLTIPTYKTQKPEKNPLFLEKRVYQGSSGKVYPFPVTERVFDEKVNEDYDAVILENKYIQITFLPELGGRIYRALDKTNNYDFVYYNHVIKPALVGLTGSWISGGIEFNWPQHHRPDTFLPVEYSIKDNEDGSKTLWMSDIDRMYGTKVLVGFTMFPDKAYLKMKEVFSNPTDLPQTFLWWANPAVPVNEHTQSIFPPDVHAVFDHGKRAVSNFPIATGEYYKVDYSKGVDISRYKNVPVPTSFMAAHSDADFLGNYDYKKKAGLLHIADHHTSPGKKQWTWGNGNFGKSWDHQLTDNDGSYIELMVGTFTDNQPDFTWLAPHEEKSAIEYFMPYKGVGAVKNATIDAAVNLEKSDDVVNIKIYATGEFDDTTVTLWQGNKKLKEKTVNLNPQNVYTYSLKGVIGDVSSLLVDVRDAKGRLLVDYQPKKEEKRPIPEAAKVIASPVNLKTNDELYFAAIHLEQYRHASYWPEDYYLEGLKRDPLDFRINDAYGLLLYRRGLFEKSEKYFRAALKRQTEHNTNPESGSANYHLGLTLIKQDKFDMAYDAFYKATWSHDTQSVSFIEMAKIKLREKSLDQAIEFLDQALVTNGHDVITRALKIDALRKKDQIGEAQKVLKESLLIDSSSLMLQFESYLLDNITKKQVEAVFNHKLNNYLTITQIYIEISDFIAARNLLDIAPENPLKDYYLSFIYTQSGEKSAALIYAKKGEKGSPDYVFPNRLFDIIVLNSVRKTNPDDGLANYYLGNLFYDRKVYNCAINLWEKCTKLNPKYAMAYRNLPIAYFNKQSKSELALRMLEKAFELDTNNARLVFELDSLYKKLDYPVVKRLKFLQDGFRSRIWTHFMYNLSD
ncbi:DUF5107 domain-containing protein [Pediococcus inopinatus]|uniref:DUF5107 domain-containing protein n=1 Tax=Pediococcus inopinatus TaxID=114090 RepID=UPI002B2596E2|nr:DUF5107 domain-containing protein [Pediococcus inopinatus]WPC16618.1 DUF5107 domain-containing protein [Pediococcus inopinatus]